jgi:hypothetical protein
MGNGGKLCGVLPCANCSLRDNGGDSMIDFGNGGGEEESLSNTVELNCEVDLSDIIEAEDMSKESDMIYMKIKNKERREKIK